MPAKSEKQRRLMAMAYNDPDMGIPKEVAKKFMKKPAKGYKKGGKMPDLTGDGKVTQADVLKGRGVFKKRGKVGYHRMPDGTMMKDSEHKMKKGGTVKKYQAGGMTSSRRPKARPEDMEEEMMAKRKRGGAPKPSMRPKARPEMIGNTPGSQGTRGIDPMENYGPENAKRMTGMKKGGKGRGCGMARGGAVRQCKMVKMKGS